jgi:hypothetical protein
MLLRLARTANYHAAKHWMDAELGYEQGRPLKPEDEAATLQQRGADLVRELRTITERLERLSQPPLPSPRTGASGPRSTANSCGAGPTQRATSSSSSLCPVVG